MNHTIVNKAFSLISMCFLLQACATTQPNMSAPDKHDLYVPKLASESEQIKTLDNFPSLVSDHRSHRIGDSVTVMIMEEATSTTSADTKTRKSSDLSARLSDTSRVELAGVNLDNNSTGAGEINREGRLVASVSATIQQVLSTGEMVIFGEQRIEFNDETQYIRISGRIRPQDISSGNVVLSSRISQAEITYKGDGLLGSRQKPGVITTMFNWLF